MLVGLTGVGGGSLMDAVAILLFGIQPTSVVGTDLLFATSTKATGTVQRSTRSIRHHQNFVMSALGQNVTFAHVRAMSGLTSITDIG